MLLFAAMLIGIGSSVFHPESARVARMASGGRHGLAQSLFQVGGNTGSALGPLTAALVVASWGQKGVALYSAGRAAGHRHSVSGRHAGTSITAWRACAPPKPPRRCRFSRGRVAASVAILLLLIFSKYFYLASITSYFTFYLIHTFHVSVRQRRCICSPFWRRWRWAPLSGGPLGDRFGRKYVIWFSILGMLPFTLMLPFANLFWTGVLSVIIGLILASAFPAIVVYAQELLPGRLGMVSGLFYGFAFGMGGVGAALLGALADATSIDFRL